MITTTRATCGEHGAPLFFSAGLVLCEQGCEMTWSDLQPEVDDRVSTREGDEIFASEVIVISEDGLYGGVYFDIERVGGNCTALVRETDDGGHLVLSDGQGSHDLSGRVVASLYGVDGWHDGSDPVWTA